MVIYLLNFRIAFAVATNVWQSVHTLRVGPEVWCLTQVIVLVATWRRDLLSDNGERTAGECFIRVALEFSQRRADRFVTGTNPLFRCSELFCIKQEDARCRRCLGKGGEGQEQNNNQSNQKKGSSALQLYCAMECEVVN